MTPVQDVLPDLLAALRVDGRALLIAPPGAGKTTGVAPALLDEEWCTGEILLLVPRRLAARAAAEYMAGQRDERPGQTIGYATRLDSKLGKATRVVVLTYGVFLSRIQADPELTGVSALLFDEVHERSLDGDLALALALDAAPLRPDLRILAMSATLDGDRFGRLLGQPKRIVSEGKSFPLTIQYARRDAAARLEPQMASAIRTALGEHKGSLLAFLPGVAEIERTADALGALQPICVLHKLHGSVDPAAQRQALAPPPAGQRKVVLATSIAETSVTLNDVRIVVDSGLARRPRYDRGAGLTRLVTERASRAAATQRAGRAARQAPGVAIRLWEEAATASMPEHDPPEILEADLSSLLLTCLQWGQPDPTLMPFLDPPPAAGLGEARERLLRLGATDADGRITDHGWAIAALPLEPRLAHMLIEAEKRGFGAAAAAVATLLTERGLGRNDADLELRYRRWRSDRSPRAEAARRMAQRFSKSPGETRASDLAKALALAFPDRVSRRRGGGGENWQSIGGRGFRLDSASPLASSQWLAVGEVAGHAAGARILSAAAIDETDVLDLFADRIETRHEAAFDLATGGVTPLRSRRIGNIRLSSGPDPAPDSDVIEAELLAAVGKHGVDLLPWNEAARELRHRAAFARALDESVPALNDETLTKDLETWLAPLLSGKRRLGDIAAGGLADALRGMLGYEGMRAVDRLAPGEFASPAGSRHPIDYAAPGGPMVEVRPQALFGLATHPHVGGGRVPLTLALTSPAGRPIQTTRDLPGFWLGSWREVAREMRGRYPRHPWPDDPASASATLRTKRADARNQ
ncbi:ATP-dependent helicase HrpB [Sphingomonas piscis]|uniref:ATP-dependent helicase HrpB n=1 Tax=Sphingomonas piscis TaxID=2714943 RepID=A0A6G7YNH1_9SPHN|nr:ATP-dependent helicase HrpB [Sphingomonas piscis]QIK78284.1 ATP-dependent helicase HrpB [Sphingomonas piscis]